jgi:hypothetical protein
MLQHVEQKAHFDTKDNLLKGNLSLGFEQIVLFTIPDKSFHPQIVALCVPFGNNF